MCVQASLTVIHSCPDDYRQRLVSMFSLFGTKFVKLYSGPMWRVETTLQEQQAPRSFTKVPVKVHVHVYMYTILCVYTACTSTCIFHVTCLYNRQELMFQDYQNKHCREL